MKDNNKLIGIIWSSPYTDLVMKEAGRIVKEQELDNLDRIAIERDLFGFLKDEDTRNSFNKAYERMKDQYIEELEFDFSAGLIEPLTSEEAINILEYIQGLTDVINKANTSTRCNNLKDQSDIIATKTIAQVERTKKNLELRTIPREG